MDDCIFAMINVYLSHMQTGNPDRRPKVCILKKNFNLKISLKLSGILGLLKEWSGMQLTLSNRKRRHMKADVGGLMKRQRLKILLFDLSHL